MPKAGIYLDNAAATAPMPVLSQIAGLYDEEWCYNPSALYLPAMKLTQTINGIRRILSKTFGSDSHKCIFTGSGSEAANMVICNSIDGCVVKGQKNIVCGAAEHPCVTESVKTWDGIYEIRWIRPDRHGGISADGVFANVDKNTALVSVGHVNNITGARNDIEAIADGVKKINKNTLFHSDGVQAYVKYPVTGTSNIDYYTVSAHKVHALPGTGAVFYKPGVPFKTWIYGGGQENGLRSGTENVLGIMAFGKAVEEQREQVKRYNQGARATKRKMLDVLEHVGGIEIISPIDPSKCSDYILTVAFPGVSGALLVQAMEAEGIYIANGAACSARKTDAISYLGKDTAQCMVRLSLSAYTDRLDAIHAAQTLVKKAEILRCLS